VRKNSVGQNGQLVRKNSVGQNGQLVRKNSCDWTLESNYTDCLYEGSLCDVTIAADSTADSSCDCRIAAAALLSIIGCLKARSAS